MMRTGVALGLKCAGFAPVALEDKFDKWSTGVSRMDLNPATALTPHGTAAVRSHDSSRN